MLALAFLAVIAVSVAATVWFTHRGSGNQAAVSSPVSSGGVASAGDTGPVGIITEDPTCDRWQTLAGERSTKLEEWGKREPAIPAAAWTPDQRRVYESTARVLLAASDQTVPLARDTPHRVMRELYEQQIAYSRAYAERIPTYTPADNYLAEVRNNLAGVLSRICDAISDLSAADRESSVPTVSPPTHVAPIGSAAEPEPFLKATVPVCSEISAQADRINAELTPWYKVDSSVPGKQWDEASRLLWEKAAPVLNRDADEIEAMGRSSGNSVMEDFMVLSAQYFRAFASSFPSYLPADAKLYAAANMSHNAVNSACDAVRGR